MNRWKATLIICSCLVFSIGAFQIFDATSAEILERSLSKAMSLPFFKQLLCALSGAVFAFFLYRVDIETLIRCSPVLFYVCTFLLLLSFVPSLGYQINGARRWVGIGRPMLQPSEFMKYILPLFFLSWIAKKKNTFQFRDFLGIFFLMALPVGLVLVQPDHGSAMIILFGMLATFFLTKVRWMYWALPIMVIVALGVGYAVTKPHVRNRIEVYLHPERDLLGKGHQPYQAKIAIGSGGGKGRGFGESLQKLYLPEARNDYIAAIFAEEWGFIGVFVLILVYMVITMSGFLIAHQADEYSFYVAAVYTFLFSFQSFLNLAIVSGLLPSKGTNLPFFSLGGSSLIANILAVTVVVRCAKSKAQVPFLSH